MSAGGSAMVRGCATSSNKGAPTDENAFREQRDSLNYPINYNDTLKKYRNCYKTDRQVRSRKICTSYLGLAKPLDF